MAAAGTKGAPERDCEAMTLQRPPLAPRGASAPVLYVHSMPAWVLEDFCRKMDCLSDYDWMRFGEGPALPGAAGGDGAHGGSAARTGGQGAQGSGEVRVSFGRGSAKVRAIPGRASGRAVRGASTALLQTGRSSAAVLWDGAEPLRSRCNSGFCVPGAPRLPPLALRSLCAPLGLRFVLCCLLACFHSIPHVCLDVLLLPSSTCIPSYLLPLFSSVLAQKMYSLRFLFFFSAFPSEQF